MKISIKNIKALVLKNAMFTSATKSYKIINLSLSATDNVLKRQTLMRDRNIDNSIVNGKSIGQ